MAMDPMPMSEPAPLVRDHAAEFHGIQGWPATPKLVPTVIVCKSLPVSLHCTWQVSELCVLLTCTLERGLPASEPAIDFLCT